MITLHAYLQLAHELDMRLLLHKKLPPCERWLHSPLPLAFESLKLLVSSPATRSGNNYIREYLFLSVNMTLVLHIPKDALTS